MANYLSTYYPFVADVVPAVPMYNYVDFGGPYAVDYFHRMKKKSKKHKLKSKKTKKSKTKEEDTL